MNRRRLHALLPGGVLGLALGAALGACAPPPPETPALLRLWQDNGGAFPAARAATPAPDSGAPAATGPLLECSFQGESGWFLGVHDAAAQLLRFQPFSPANGELRLQHEGAWVAVTSLAVHGGEALSVQLEGRAVGPAATPAVQVTPSVPVMAPVPVLAVVELRHPFDSSATLTPKDVVSLVDPRRHATHLLTTPAGAPADGSAQRWSLDFVTDRLTETLVLYLLAPSAPAPASLTVERLSVAHRPLAQVLEAGGEFPGLKRLPPHRAGSGEDINPAGTYITGPDAVAVAFDRDERKGLLALPGRRYSFSIGRSPGARRLDLSLGVAPRDASIEGAVRVRIEADGALLHEQRLTAPPDAETPAWNDLSLSLPATPETSLVLTLSAEGEGSDPPLAVFGHPQVRRAGPRSRPNVLLISLDTLRPDRLGCYGGDPAISPRLDALAAEGLRFQQASSTSSYTLPSHGSMLTGQYPAIHGAVDIDDRLDPQRSPFLARVLADAGYVTAAFTGGGYVATDYGFGEGFDRYSHNDPVWAVDGVRGQQLLETVSGERLPAQLPLLRRYAAPAIAEWIARQDDGVPFFAFVHTYIVHNYAPDQHWLQRRGLLDAQGRELPFNHQDRQAFNGGADVPRQHVVSQYMPYYDATIGMADAFVGGLLDELRSSGLSGDTLVIVTSDHGEEFGEHGFFGHGETLFEDVTRVPLIVRLPQGAAAPPGELPLTQPAVLTAPVSLVDVAPWILRIVGLPLDPRMLACDPPFGPDAIWPPRRGLLLMELDTRRNRLSAVREGPLKLHTLLDGQAPGVPADRALLYDLKADRGETTDVAASRAVDAQRLLSRLQAFHDCTQSVHPREEHTPFDPEWLRPDLQEELGGLGYLGK